MTKINFPENKDINYKDLDENDLIYLSEEEKKYEITIEEEERIQKFYNYLLLVWLSLFLFIELFIVSIIDRFVIHVFTEIISFIVWATFILIIAYLSIKISDIYLYYKKIKENK